MKAAAQMNELINKNQVKYDRIYRANSKDDGTTLYLE